MESEACPWGHANPLQWHDAENQGAGGVADAVDHDPLATVANLRIFGFVLVDQPTEITRDAVLRMGG
jgi:hypothetical protein